MIIILSCFQCASYKPQNHDRPIWEHVVLTLPCLCYLDYD